MLSLFEPESPYAIEIEAVDEIFQFGKIVDGFLIGEEVYQGGMAVLKKAIQIDTKQEVLLKIPRVGKDQPVENLICFETELIIMRSLDSPYVPRFIAGGNMAMNPYIAMEKIPGVSLESMIVIEKQLPIDYVIKIAINLAKAIQTLHHQEVIHGMDR